MIGWLSGVILHRDLESVVVDVHGVGYRVQVPVGVIDHVPEGDPIELWIHTHVREGEISLFGFGDQDQQRTFDCLVSVSGVGPKGAVAILGGISPEELAAAVELADIKRLKKLSGVGKKLAERLAVELRDKLRKAGIVPRMDGHGSAGMPPGARVVVADVWADVSSALSNLDFKRGEVEMALAQVRQQHPEGGDFDALFMAAMSVLRR